MKKGFALFSVLLAGIIISSYLVSAAEISEQLTNVIDGAVQVIEPVARYLLGETPSGEWLFAKVLFLLIILAVVWTALNNIEFFSENTWVLVVVSLGASILATRWLTEGIVQTILLPYTAMGIAVSAAIPFVVYFILVNWGFKNQPSIVRKIAWIFFAVIFIGLWIVRGTQIPGVSAWIYPVTAIAALIMAGMDGTIHRFFVQVTIEKSGKTSKDEAIVEIKRKLNELPGDYTAGIITSAELKKREKEYKKQLATLYK